MHPCIRRNLFDPTCSDRGIHTGSVAHSAFSGRFSEDEKRPDRFLHMHL